MKIRGVVGLVIAMAGTACGPMPGYVEPERESATPAAPPAPAPRAKVAAPEPEDNGDEVTDRDEPEDNGDEVTYQDEERPPRPPRYNPPPRYVPPADRTPSRYTPPAREPEPEPTRPEPLPSVPAIPAVKAQEKVRKVPIDEDTYYLLDPVRKLCFLRHKDTMTSLDCAKIPEAKDFAGASEAPAPTPAPAPERLPEPTRVTRGPEPAPEKNDGSPTPDEIARFEGAFVDIFCDRKGGDDVAPEQRIKDRGLTVDRYESLEGWWANDEKAWWTLTDKARKSCPQR